MCSSFFLGGGDCECWHQSKKRATRSSGVQMKPRRDAGRGQARPLLAAVVVPVRLTGGAAASPSRGQTNPNSSSSRRALGGDFTLGSRSKTYVNTSTGVMHRSPAGEHFLPSALRGRRGRRRPSSFSFRGNGGGGGIKLFQSLRFEGERQRAHAANEDLLPDQMGFKMERALLHQYCTLN